MTSLLQPSISLGLTSTTPSEVELVLAVQASRQEQPELGALKILDHLRARGWSLSEKRLKKVIKSFDAASPSRAPAGKMDDRSILPLTPPPTPPKAFTPLPLAANLSPRPKGARGRVRAPKPVASTSSLCIETSACEHKAHMDRWLPGKLLRVRVHLDFLHSLAPPSGNTLLTVSKLHVHICESTGAEYVLAPEVCRAVWPRLDSRIARLAHSMYTPSNGSLLPDADEEDGYRIVGGSTELVGCPQALKTARCTFISRRGELEKIWIVAPSQLDQPDAVRREIRIEFGAECHSNNPARVIPLESLPVVGKGKGRQEQGVLLRMNASDVRRIE